MALLIFIPMVFHHHMQFQLLQAQLEKLAQQMEAVLMQNFIHQLEQH